MSRIELAPGESGGLQGAAPERCDMGRPSHCGVDTMAVPGRTELVTCFHIAELRSSRAGAQAGEGRSLVPGPPLSSQPGGGAGGRREPVRSWTAPRPAALLFRAAEPPGGRRSPSSPELSAASSGAPPPPARPVAQCLNKARRNTPGS